MCSFFLWSNDSIKPNWSYTSDKALLHFRLLSERMPEWIFFAMPYEQNKVKGMRGRTRSFQGKNNKVRWMPLCLQKAASLLSKCVSVYSLFSLLQKTNGIIATGLWMAYKEREQSMTGTKLRCVDQLCSSQAVCQWECEVSRDLLWKKLSIQVSLWMWKHITAYTKLCQNWTANHVSEHVPLLRYLHRHLHIFSEMIA